MEIHLTWKEFNRISRRINTYHRGGSCDYTRDPNFYTHLGAILSPEDLAKVKAYNAKGATLAQLVPMQVVKGARVRL